MGRHLGCGGRCGDGPGRVAGSLVCLAAVLAAIVAVWVFGDVGATASTSVPSTPTITVVDRVFSPPASIASDCSRDVADPLRAWLYSLPAGTPAAPVVVRFAPGGCYLVNESLFLRSFTNVVFDGNGATFRQVAPTTEPMVLSAGVDPYAGSSFSPFAVDLTLPIAPIIWYFDGGSDITLENMTIEGPNAGQGSTSGGGTMVDSGVELDGVQRALIRNDTIEHVDGDFVTLTGLLDAPSANWDYPTTDVSVIDSTFTISGRQGITPEYVDRVSITHNTFDNVAATAIDMESDIVGGCSCNVSVTQNTFSAMAPFLVAAITGSSVTNFAFTDNTLTRGAQMKVELAPALPSSGITIADNTGTDAATWPFPSILVGRGPDADSAGPISGVEIAGNTVPDNLNASSFVYSGQNVSGLAVRDNVLASTAPLVPLVMDDSLTQGYSCGNAVASGQLPVDGPCPGGYIPPPLPTAPSMPVDALETSVTSPVAGADLSGTAKLTATVPVGVSVTAVAFEVSAPGSSAPIILPATLVGSSWSATWDTTSVPSGSGTVQSVATDSAGNTVASSPVSFEVGSPVPGPIAPFAVSTPSLGVPSVARAYAANLGTTGTIGSVRWAVVGGALPAGLALDPSGVVAGTPTTPGGAVFTVAAVDSADRTATATYSLDVTPLVVTVTSPVASIAATPDGHGYWIADASGDVVPKGDAGFYGSMTGAPLVAPVSHIVSTPDGKGYWLVASDGGIFAFGDAGFYGCMGGQQLNAPVVDVAPTPDGKGYWLVASDGGIFAFGDADFHGSMGGGHLNKPVVGISADDQTGGYWEVATDGGIFAFAAPFHGSTGGLHLNRPILSMAPTVGGRGYWFVASDGGIFAFGDAAFHGSLGGQTLNEPVVGMAADDTAGGYWLVAADGGVFGFAAPFFGSA